MSADAKLASIKQSSMRQEESETSSRFSRVRNNNNSVQVGELAANERSGAASRERVRIEPSMPVIDDEAASMASEEAVMKLK